ncbi:MAG: NAD(P)H-dependent oxidoreductase, partial [Cyanobacteria bacterium]|nr:NAD(P)H-dependent oxidoreductase [Cyanobacteriota bacterium]
MGTLLYIEASPMGELSHSSTVAQKDFLPAYQKAFPNDTIDHLNLWDEPMPAFNRDLHNTKYAIHHHLEVTPEQQANWKTLESMAKRFLAADRYLMSVPMWNYGIPYI